MACLYSPHSIVSLTNRNALTPAKDCYGTARPLLRSARLRTTPSARSQPVVSSKFSFPNIFGNKASGTQKSRKKEVDAAKKDLLGLLEGSQRGVVKVDRGEVEAVVDRFNELQGDTPTTGADLSGVWELMWTSEKEVLFLLEKGIFAVGPAQASYQVIDVDNGTLQNVITFGEDSESAFVVQSSLEPTSDVRVQFQFQGAELRLPKRTFKIPPLGKGWFDTVYLDKTTRMARDVRGDTGIYSRTNLPLDAFQ
eukprot:CAMPEP_0198230154 /NCGR_PEP_ID=MMETSP1445-20131203/114510_1 /TAXON_ID=36898 /ORGANISM="Pyramimonas sp., Strain CCMP2087" /LENGTH=251 /DNA_ID=CAMNT_0043910669 /DNA_START=73 /DNA_END=828 /DNA_ORIENTATION=+